MTVIVENDQNQLRQYLLGRLTGADEEQVELRLLSDSTFQEEFDTVVDEIVALYVTGQFHGEDKRSVEEHFFKSPERRQKLAFMTELLRQVEAEQAEPVASVRHDKRPGFSERVRAFFSGPKFAPRFATVAMAIVLLVIGGVWLSRSGGPGTVNYATLTLAVSDSERSAGPAPKIESVKLPADVNELRLELLLPSPPPEPVRYRADFAPPANVRGLTIAGQDSRAVGVAVPASALKPDRYAVRLFMIHPDGHEERVPGSYFFRVE